MPANLWIAASDNDIEQVKKYISSGQHGPVDKDPNGYTPVHAAASYGHIELLRYLITEAGGDINVTDEDGDTPLHAVENVETAKVLIDELNADFKLKNAEGQTALEKIHEEDEFPEVVEYLQSITGETVLATASGTDEISLPANTSMRYTYEDAPGDGEIDENQRKRLEAIINSENPEAGLQQFVQEAVHSQFGPGGEESGSTPYKKSRQ